MKELVGVNFSSRNRPEILEICLTQLYRYLLAEKYAYVVSVVVDLGDPTWDAYYLALMEKYPDVIWHKSGERLGIANAKNRGIKILRENHCGHYFLFDDDAFPVKHAWEQLYIDIAARNGIHHLMHLFALPAAVHHLRTENEICEYHQCCGVLLYFSAHAINTIGGYRKVFGVYGHEHTELSLRCNFAGLQPNWGPYISPEKTREYIYSLDLDLINWGVNPPDFVVTPDMWRSSIQGENVLEHIHYNAQVFGQTEPIFEEI